MATVNTISSKLRRVIAAAEPWYDWGEVHVERMEEIRVDEGGRLHVGGEGPVRYFELQCSASTSPSRSAARRSRRAADMPGTRETAELFIAVGGRLMVAPGGEVEAQINAGLALSLTADPADTQRVVTASRAIDHVIDAEPRAIADLVGQRGHRRRHPRPRGRP